MYMSVFATDGWTVGPELEVHLEAIYVGFCLTPRQTLTELACWLFDHVENRKKKLVQPSQTIQESGHTNSPKNLTLFRKY
jgi:hypothetical protein